MYRPSPYVAILCMVGIAIATASPVKVEETIRLSKLEDGGLACHKAADYSTEWFLQNIKPEYSQPFLNTALFYSAHMSAAARRLAAEAGLITIWDPWPCYLYNHHLEPSNPLRCIHNNDKEREVFFMHMSRGFAQKALNLSTVLHSPENYKNPPTTGIWGKVEFPVLTRGGAVNWLKKTNENKSLSEIFWERPRNAAIGFWNNVILHAGELKRSVGVNTPSKGPPPLPPDFVGKCLAPRELTFYDDMEW